MIHYGGGAHAGNGTSALSRPLFPLHVRSRVTSLRSQVMIAAQHCMTPALQALLRDQPLSSGKVSLAWSAAVGRTIDRVTSVSLDSAGTLTVSAIDRHWAREVGRSAALIRSRVNQLLGDGVVTRIAVTTRPPR